MSRVLLGGLVAALQISSLSALATTPQVHRSPEPVWVEITPRNYKARKHQIVQALRDSQAAHRETFRGMNTGDHAGVLFRDGFKLSAPTADTKKDSNTRILHLDGNKQSDVNFVARLIQADEFHAFANTIGAGRITLHTRIPSVDVEPFRTEIFAKRKTRWSDTTYQLTYRDQRTVNFDANSQMSLETISGQILDPLRSSPSILAEKTSQLLGVELARITPHLAEDNSIELLSNLGFAFVPERSDTHHWVKVREADPVYEEVATSLAVLRKRGLVYADGLARAENTYPHHVAAASYGFISEAEYRNTWAAADVIMLSHDPRPRRQVDNRNLLAVFADAIDAASSN